MEMVHGTFLVPQLVFLIIHVRFQTFVLGGGGVTVEYDPSSDYLKRCRCNDRQFCIALVPFALRLGKIQTVTPSI